MSVRHQEIGQVLFEAVILAMSRGLTYQETTAMFQAAAALMEQVERTPGMSDSAMTEMAASLIEARLRSSEPMKENQH